MKWYEIIGLIAAWMLGLYLTGKFYEHLRDRHYNDSWKSKGKK
jgi:hypothetical protein